MSVITIVYGIVAFTGLGDRKGVSSFCRFDELGQEAVIEFNEPLLPGSIMYFGGIYTGNYGLSFSSDGSAFSAPEELPQQHGQVLKWNYYDISPDHGPVKSVKITSDYYLWLGEMAFFDKNGERIDASRLTFNAFAAPLFDEQEMVPEYPYYLNSAYFDESYHVRTAIEHMEDIWPYEISHPPLGKIIISLGIRLFGLTPFGWRFMGTLTGVLMLPFMYLFLKKLFGGFIIPCCGTLIFAFDFMHYVQTRIATIDSYGVFFILLMYFFFWMYLEVPRGEGISRGKWLPALMLSGISFGLGTACKWICLYAGAGLALIWLIDRIQRGILMRREGKSRFFIRETGENVLWCVLFFVLIPAVIYYLSYYPYGRAQGLEGVTMFFSREYAGIVLENQSFMLNYHSGVHTPHPYASRWYEWILDIRPILYFLKDFGDGTRSSIAAFLNPVLCWAGLASVIMIAPRAVLLRDKRAGFLCIAYLANILPWIMVQRILFAYHYFAMTVFLVPALCSVFAPLEKEDRRVFIRNLCGLTALSVFLFAVFYPVLSGIRTPVWYIRGGLQWVRGFWQF